MTESNELLDIWEMFYETLEESYLKNPRWQNVRKHRLRFAILFTYKDWCELFWTLKAKIDAYKKQKESFVKEIDNIISLFTLHLLSKQSLNKIKKEWEKR